MELTLATCLQFGATAMFVKQVMDTMEKPKTFSRDTYFQMARIARDANRYEEMLHYVCRAFDYGFSSNSNEEKNMLFEAFDHLLDDLFESHEKLLHNEPAPSMKVEKIELQSAFQMLETNTVSRIIDYCWEYMLQIESLTSDTKILEKKDIQAELMAKIGECFTRMSLLKIDDFGKDQSLDMALYYYENALELTKNLDDGHPTKTKLLTEYGKFESARGNFEKAANAHANAVLCLSAALRRVRKARLEDLNGKVQAMETRPIKDVTTRIAAAMVSGVGHTSATDVSPQKDILPELSAYAVLAQKLGRLAMQLVAGDGVIQSIKIVYKLGRVIDDIDTSIIRAYVTRAISPSSISEEHMLCDSAEYPLHSVQLLLADVECKFNCAVSNDGGLVIEGSVKNDVPYLTCLGSFDLDMPLEGTFMLCKPVDEPGIIGTLGKILGDCNVNINFFSVKGKQSIMAIGVDKDPNEEALKKMGEVPAIQEFIVLKP